MPSSSIKDEKTYEKFREQARPRRRRPAQPLTRKAQQIRSGLRLVGRWLAGGPPDR